MPSSPSRTNRFQSFTPLRSTTGSLRRLKTALSPTRNSPRSASPSQRSSSSGSSSLLEVLAIRHKPSVVEFQMQQERSLFEQELHVLEPRPSSGRGSLDAHVVGIFEVLDGKC
ncbi:hypothetical protein ACJBU6_05840 [Exserohilum turcicum]